MTVTPLILATLALAATATHAQPDLLWDNGEYDTWDHGKGISSERDTLVLESWIVDDFVVDQPAALHRLEWLALWYPGYELRGADFILLTENLDPVVELFDHEFSRELKGTAFGGIEVYDLTIPNLGIEIGPGRYYVGARFVGFGDGRGFAAGQYTLRGQTEAYFRSEYFGYPDWGPSGYGVDAVFQVYGDIIPTPPTLALTALAPLAPLALRRRR